LSIRQGDIVWAWLFDPQGNNRKHRRSVVVTSSDEIGPGSIIVVVAITSVFDENNPRDGLDVPIPWASQGHVKTTLTKPCVAMCDWQDRKKVEEVEKVGLVPGRQLFQILQAVANLAEE